MTKKVSLFALGLAVTVGATADVVHLAGSGRLHGNVVGYAEGMFQVQIADSAVTNINAADVRGVDFEHGHVTAQLETKSNENITGKLWLLDKQRFHIEGPNGTTLYLPFANVATAQFNYEAEPPKPAPKRVEPVLPTRDEVQRPTTEPDIEIITHGDRVNVLQRLGHGKVTIVEFYATWCAPCRQIAPVLERLARDDADIAIRKVDIVRWGSPVAEQYNINAVPRLQVYGADQTLVRTLAGLRSDELLEAIQHAKASLR